MKVNIPEYLPIFTPEIPTFFPLFHKTEAEVLMLKQTNF